MQLSIWFDTISQSIKLKSLQLIAVIHDIGITIDIFFLLVIVLFLLKLFLQFCIKEHINADCSWYI